MTSVAGSAHKKRGTALYARPFSELCDVVAPIPLHRRTPLRSPSPRAPEVPLTLLSHLLNDANVRRVAAQRLSAPVAEDAANGVCEVDFIDNAKVARVLKRLPSDESSLRVADAFSAFADPTRLKLLHALSAEELCVCDLASIVQRSMAATSRQLQLLRRLDLVKYRTSGKLAYYSLKSEWARTLVADAFRQTDSGPGAGR